MTPRERAAFNDLYSFVAVMFGRGADCVIPETVTTPLGAPVKIGGLMREVDSIINQWTHTDIKDAPKDGRSVTIPLEMEVQAYWDDELKTFVLNRPLHIESIKKPTRWKE